MKSTIKDEIFCCGFPCTGCPFNDSVCKLMRARDETVFRLAIKSARFNEYLDRAKRRGITFSGRVVLR